VPETTPDHGVAFRDAARFWIRLGFINFGGPTGQIAIMHEELVERRRWVSEARFLHALNFCMLLPGPEAQQLAIYLGWLLHRAKGGLIAGIGFVLPAFFVILGLSWAFVVHGDLEPVAGLFAGLQASVVGIIAAAGIRIGRRVLRHPALAALAVAAFVAIFVFHVPFPLIVLGAGLIGFVGGRSRPDVFALPEEGSGQAAPALRDDVVDARHTASGAARTARVLLVGLAVWMVPLAAVALFPGAPDVLGQEAVFFSQAAMVTFGGAYAVLAYLNQAAVAQFGWLTQAEMVTGLGLAESTPGPLIMVTEFVGFVAGYRNPGGLDPLVAGVIGATVTTWATFAPSFLWVFLGAPYIERLRGNRAFNRVVSAITAAVVGVIANLAVTFAVRSLFDEVRDLEFAGGPIPAPVLGSVDPISVVIAVASFVALWRFKVNILWVIGIAAAAGVARTLLV
jgi:chromate transporter